jgi:hypothetical protein
MKFKTTLKIVQSQIGKFKHLKKENLILKKMQIQIWKSTLRKKKRKLKTKKYNTTILTLTQVKVPSVCVCVCTGTDCCGVQLQ